MNRIAEDVYEGARELWLMDIDPHTGKCIINTKDKGVMMKHVNQKDIDHVGELWQLDKFSIQTIAEITKRTWSTIKTIIDSGFNLETYKQLSKAARIERKTKLTFRPFNAKKSPGPVKIAEIPVKPTEIPNSLSNTNDVLEHMWNVQQDAVRKVLRDKTETAANNEAIHKIRNGLQKINEGLGELL